MTPYTDYGRQMQRLDRRRQLRAVLYVALILISFVVVALMASGCSKEMESIDVKNTTAKTIATHSEPGPSFYVHEVNLKDGTRCVVATTDLNNGGASIVCQWKDRQ